MGLRNKNINENQNFLDKKYIIFDDEATRRDIIKIYNIVISMGVTPLSVIRSNRNTIDTWIYTYVDEIEDFIDTYGGAYFRIWVTSYDKQLALDYGAIHKNDLNIDSVEDSRLIYFKDLLDTSDINFFPENLNENYKDNDTPEVGDNLVCHKSVVMQYSGEVEATEGKLYEIILVTHDRLAIINNSNHEHFFSIKKGDDSFYKKWFSPSMSIEIDTFFEPLD